MTTQTQTRENLISATQQAQRDQAHAADAFYADIATRIIASKGDNAAQADILAGLSGAQLEEVGMFIAHATEAGARRLPAIIKELGIRQAYKPALTEEERASVVCCWGRNGECTNPATNPEIVPERMGLCASCLGLEATQARELIYELQASGALPSALEVDDEVIEPADFFDRPDYVRQAQEERHIYALTDGMDCAELKQMTVAEYEAAQENAENATDGTWWWTGPYRLAPLLPSEVDGLKPDTQISDTLPAIQADARATYLARLYHAAAIVYAWIEATFPADYQAPQIKALDKAFKALRGGTLVSHIDVMADGQHVVVFESQSRENLEHTATASGCSCREGKPETCLHYPAGRILVLATAGIDPAGLLPVPVVEVAA